jgi:cation diffusion facilitator CzcD-associated flavoprotein CzcO
MTTPAPAANDKDPAQPPAEVDVLVVGAGVTGIYQLYLAREAGFSVLMLEAGTGVGGTWYWNRYPGARYDSESYTYGYFFSKELFQDWTWPEEFTGQAENERYFNHVVDRFDLRRHIRFNTRIVAEDWDEESARWTVRAEDGLQVRARFVVNATGVLSVPYFPAIPGREDFKGIAHHTGLWPKEPVDFKGKRVAVVGTGSSGVQVIPIIADEVASLTVYQRTPNWCIPLNNRIIPEAEQAQIKADFERIRDTVNTSMSGFLHVPHNRKTFEDTREQRWAFYEKMWRSPGFAKLGTNYTDLLTNKDANAEWCAFLEEKYRSIVKDPATVAKLIPSDHLYAGKRPPYGTDYFEAFNKPNVELVDLRETPMVRVTASGIETTDGEREFDIIVWATGFDFGTGALLRMGIRGAGRLSLNDYWAEGPLTYLGVMARGFPNMFFPGGPHGGAGNNPRYNGDQSEFIHGIFEFMRQHDYHRVEAPAEAEKSWMDMVDLYSAKQPFGEKSFFFGANIPGKPKRFLNNPGGRLLMKQMMAETVESEYKSFLS